MKTYLAISALFSFSVALYSQDLITLKDGTDIKSKVTEVGVEEIKYKKYDNLDGPTYSIMKRDVFLIRYENGTKDIINPQTQDSYVAPTAEKQKTKSTDENMPEKLSSLYFNIGYSSALGDFGSNNTNLQNVGYAEGGANLSLYYELRFTSYFGMGVKWYGNSNNFNGSYIANQLSNNTGVQWVAKDSYYSGGGILFGSTFHIPLTNKFFIDFRILGGYTWLNTPLIQEYVASVPSVWVEQSSVTNNAFGYDFGTGMTFYVSPRWSLRWSADYQGANYEFVGVPVTNSAGNYTTVNFQTPWRVFNLTGGIGFNF